MIEPHGGKLVNRIVENKEEFTEKAKNLKKIFLNKREISDLEMIATGGFSPLEGFVTKKDYENIVENKRLSSGLVWTIPVVLSCTKDEADNLKEGEEIGLYEPRTANNESRVLALLHLEEKYTYDKKKEARLVFGTESETHPGVAALYKQGEILLAGKISMIYLPEYPNFSQYNLKPYETRKIFEQRKWRRIVGFQTRNPVHRAHEYILKCALEITDGLLLHPIVGETKIDDIPAEVRMQCYEVLLGKYYPKDRVVLSINPANMRYAGPREAIFHAIIRKNYGCTHFIVGRDHAGIGNYYSPFAAQEIFDEFSEKEIGITPLFFANAFYCRKCSGMVSEKTCPHSADDHFSLSGTRVRELLKSGEIPPAEFTRPEVANILIQWWRENQ